MRYPLLGSLRDNAWVLVSVLLAVNVLSLLDGALTLFEVSSGIAVEGNPLLRALIGTDPRVALAFKVGVVGTVSAVIWTARRYRAAIGLSLVALTAYAAVIVVHLLGLNHAGIL